MTSGLNHCAHAQSIKSARLQSPSRTGQPSKPSAAAERAIESPGAGLPSSNQVNVTRNQAPTTAASTAVLSTSRSAFKLQTAARSAVPSPVSDSHDQATLAPMPDGGQQAGPAGSAVTDPLFFASGQTGALDGRTVACQAACCWPLARFLEQRAATIRSDAKHGLTNHAGSASVESSFLRRQAARQRDVAAASALRVYYSWIANRDQLVIAAEASQLAQQQSATQAALIERGVAIDDPTELQRKQLEVRDNQLQLESNDIQLAQTLLRLTCCASDPRTAAVEGLQIVPSELACDQLVAFALEHRQDYLAYVELCQCLDERTARAVADLLSPLAGGVGVGMLDAKCLEKLCIAARGSEALAHVTRELRSAIDLQRRLIQQTVCDKCQALRLAYERTTIAEQTLATWNERIAALSRLEQLGEARGQALFAARGEQLRARSTLVSRQLSARLAEIDLAEAMGELAPRCCRGEPWLVTCN